MGDSLSHLDDLLLQYSLLPAARQEKPQLERKPDPSRMYLRQEPMSYEHGAPILGSFSNDDGKENGT